MDPDAPAARGERPGERVRRRHARAGPAQGRGADPDQRVLVRAAGRGGPLALHHGDAPTRSSRASRRCAGHRGGARGPRHAGAPHRRRCRSSASCAATSPARRGRSTGDTGTLAGEPLPAGLRRERPARAAALLARHQGRERATTINVTFDADGSRARAASSPTRLRDAELRGLPRRPGLRRGAAGSSSPTPSSSSARDADGTLLPHRRGADARLVALLAGRSLRAGRRAAELRQAAAARLSRRRSRPAGGWNGEAPPPPLPAEVVEATSARYLEAYRLLTGRELRAPRDPHRARGPVVHRRRLGDRARAGALRRPRRRRLAGWAPRSGCRSRSGWSRSSATPSGPGPRGDRLIVAPGRRQGRERRARSTSRRSSAAGPSGSRSS